MDIGTTTLGDGLAVSRMGFGAMALSGAYGPSSREEDLAVLHHALDIGVSFLDTSDFYAAGENERLLGEVARTRREEMVLATKFGITGDLSANTVATNNDPAYVRRAVEASLERLGVDSIDLLYLHRRQVSVPLHEVVGTMAEMVADGSVRHLGLSEVTAGELEEAQAIHPIAAVQSEWSVWSRDVEREVVPAAARLGVGFVPYSPLGRGFLTDTHRRADDVAADWRGTLSRFTGDAFEANRTIPAVLRGIAEDHGATPAQIALAWLIASGERHGLPVVPIPGTRRPSRVEENAGALAIELAAEEQEAIDALSAQVVGDRSDSADPDWTSDQRECAQRSPSR